RALTSQANSDILAALTPEQQSTLRSASRGMSTLNNVGIPPALAMELKLTEDQKTKLGQIATEVRDKLKTGAKKRDLQLEVKPRVEAILTADQKAIVEKYVAAHRKGKRKPA